MIRQQILTDLKRALKKLEITGAEPTLEYPSEETHGDYSTNCAMVAFRAKGHSLAPSILRVSARGGLVKSIAEYKSSLDLAQAIVANFPKTPYLEKIEAVAPGFVNFFLKPEYIYNSIDDYGQTDLLKGKKIMVEFAHPNTHKMFHIGHLRNITTGETIVRILEANGVKVIRANYQGDVGMHIAKCLWGISFKRGPLSKLKTLDEKIKFLGEAYVLGAKAYETEPKAKKEIEEINKQIYQKDKKVIELWQETRKWSLEYFEKIYQRVETHFDRFYFESECSDAGLKLASLALKGNALRSKILQRSEGAIIFDGKPYGLDTRVFVNSQGFPTYEAKELALAKLEFSEFGKLDRLIHVVGPEQASFFKVTFKVEELLGIQKGEQHHLVYGWVRLKSGKMSSRTGEVVLGEWLLDEAKKRLQEKFKMKEETAEVVAVGAVKYSLLKVGLSSEIAFDIEESINLEGDSGPYLQYTYARCRSVMAKAKDLRLDTRNWKLDEEVRSSKLKNQDSSLQPQNLASSVKRLASEELSLLRSLYRFPEIVASAGKTYSPNLLCGYLFGLAQKFNLFYNRCSILKPLSNDPGSSLGRNDPGSVKVEEVRNFRLTMTQATARILKNGLYLLGIKTVEKM